MATHDVALKVATELAVGAVDLEIPVKRNGRRIGVFTVNSNGVSWNPSTSKAPTSVSWEDLPDALSGKPAAAPAAPAAAAAAPAKKATAKKAATTTKKTAAKKSAPAETAPEPTPAPVAETPAPAPAATAKKATAKKAAKKSAPATSATSATTGAVDARAVRAWAAENGIAVAPRGPISSSIIDQFRAAS
ncbi:Lsr2 family DNA-binding protein [Kineococcus rubinsiae]|uniref:Lsr2 family DNA-binding protein n=1 Tax=Kineococcus rubinsiae TaxID=2609562 RepID=UPI001431D9A7|nr:histone-like nucleoid-structuring protein Lsr2 [Kineococcus rubinsiae]NIZ91596.1 hypothetical protein [Kineococcus rubinsiae]